MKLKKTSSLICSSFIALTANAIAMECPNDLFIGYYVEDPGANPEDPTPGSIFLNVPKEDGLFEGELFFTYVGCQSRNVGSVSGNRNANSLLGSWAGTTDGVAQSGSFSGQRNDNGSYSGSYTVDKGKQLIEIEDCIEYYVAPFGTWSIFPVAESLPEDDLIELDGNTIRWTPVTNSFATQCQLVDLDEENCNEATTTLWQDVRLTENRSMQIPSSFLVNADKYAVACSQFDDDGEVLSFSRQVIGIESIVPSSNTILAPVNALLLDDS